MNKNKPNNLPNLREILVDWAIASFFGFALASWLLEWEKVKTGLINGFGTFVYAKIYATCLLATVVFSIFGGMKLVRILIELRKTGKLSENEQLP